MSNWSGMAALKPQYVLPKLNNQPLAVDAEPSSKRLKTEARELNELREDTPKVERCISVDSPGVHESKQMKKKNRGQNKNRPMRTEKPGKDKTLCMSYVDGILKEPCADPATCPFIHDVAYYLSLPSTIKSKIDKECYCFHTYGKCYRGVTCLFSKSHTDPENRNIVNEELWKKMQHVFDSTHKTVLDRATQNEIRTRKFDFDPVNSICNEVGKQLNSKREQKAKEQKSGIKTLGPATDEDQIQLCSEELKRLDWKNKLYLSPLTTVGNLPFRRLCVDFGADITCSEMSLASSIVHGSPHEFALHRRHPSEKIWGVQLCASNPNIAAKAVHILDRVGVDYDFVDLNMGCPLDNIYRQGAGSGLMCRTNKVESMVRTMSAVLTSKNKPFTVKMRAGVKTDKYVAHDLIKVCKESGVAAITLHGRTREQRYTKTANWDYIGECAKIAAPLPLFGNGDVLSWEEYTEKKNRSNVTGIMIGRGALIKPWIFQEIKEERNIDMNSSQRLEIIQRYCNYGLDHWGSDFQGLETCRRFLLEWLSFSYRYIPLGILENPPQQMNERPPKYVGRDEMETLLSSQNASDWVKLSEMFLGPVPDNFQFLPKHKANSWG